MPFLLSRLLDRYANRLNKVAPGRHETKEHAVQAVQRGLGDTSFPETTKRLWGSRPRKEISPRLSGSHHGYVSRFVTGGYLMHASTNVLAFCVVTAQRTRFSQRDRNLLIGAAMSMDLDWGVSFSRNDAWSELASVGRVSGGEDVGDRWYFAILGSAWIELVDLKRPMTTTVHRTVAAAVEVMKAAMSCQDLRATPSLHYPAAGRSAASFPAPV